MSQPGKDIPHKQAFSALFGEAVTRLYRLSYIVGIHTIRFFKRSGRRVVRLVRPANRWLNGTTTAIKTGLWQSFAAEWRRFITGFSIAKNRVATAWHRHPVKGVGQVLALPFLAARRHRRALGKIGNIAAPAAALAVLALTLQFWTGQHFALALEVNGETVGYIQDESVLNNASAMAENRVTDGRFEWAEPPRLSIAMTKDTAVLSEEDLCNELLRISSDAVAQLCGLYVDGEFVGSTIARDNMEDALAAFKATFTADEKDKITFLQSVELREAVYPVSSLHTTPSMVEYLQQDKTVETTYTVQENDTWNSVADRYNMDAEDLKQANLVITQLTPGTHLSIRTTAPRLQVQVERLETYTKDIPFTTVTKKSDDLYVGQQEMTGGVKGKKTLKANVVLINGEEVSRQVVSETVTKDPVEQVIWEGTKTIVGNSSQNKGAFIWPVPICHNISRGLSSYHNGIDICNGPVTVNNQPFVAAAPGTVVEASYGWNGGYGNMVKIDHGNGFVTIYAHCNSLSVSAGQQVKAGDMLGLIGNTGASDGPHLHFEIRKSGIPVDPFNYF